MIQTTKLSTILTNNAFLNQTEFDNLDDFIFSIPTLQIFETGCESLFDYDFQTPQKIEKTQFLKYFYQLFLTKYFDENISYETENAFKLNVMNTTLSIMPYFSKKIDLLVDFDNTKLFDMRESKREVESNSTSTNIGESVENGGEKVLNSEEPQGLLIYDDVFSNPERISNGSAQKTNSQSHVENNTKNTNGENVVEKETYGNFLNHIEKIDVFNNLFDDMLERYDKHFSFFM